MLITTLMENFPDILIDGYNISPFYALYFAFIIFVCSIIIFGVVVGDFGGNY